MKKLFIVIISILFIKIPCNTYAFDKFDKEDFFLYKIVNNIHKKIKYGVGKKNLFFSREIMNNKIGDCGDYSILVFCKLLQYKYKYIDNVSIETYNERIHDLIQVRKKTNGKLAILDATLNIYYPNGIGALIDDPEKSKHHLGISTFPAYSNVSFWKSIKKVIYIPYRDAFILKNIKKIITNKFLFYRSPNDINALFDYNYRTYAATKNNALKEINIEIEFTKKDQISSIVIYPYNTKNYPKQIKVMCDNNIIYDHSIFLIRNLIIMNFYKPNICSKLDFIFSNFQGQNRFLLRDIYIYGKPLNKNIK